MKQKWKVFFSLLLIAILSFQIFSVALAADTDTPVPESDIEELKNITSFACNCYISGLTLYASAYLTANSSMSLNIKIELQKLKSGEYETIETWTTSRTDVLLTLDKTRLINIFATYRIKVTFTAGSESVVLYSYA